MRKCVELITVVIRAEFGVDLNDPFDKDDNAYLVDSGHENIAAAIAAGDITPGNHTYLEFGNTGDVVIGDLVSISMHRQIIGTDPDAPIQADVRRVSTGDPQPEDVGEDHLS